ncbi:hypothetical protein ACWESM_33625 [Nocardia sp. NPDC003999]
MLSTLAGHSVRDQLAGPHDLIRVVRHDITFIDQRLAASRDGSNGRSRLRYVAGRLSTAHAGVGSWSEAVEFASYAAGIVADTGSHRTLGQLRTTVTVLHAAGQTGAARELTHHVRTAQRARASHGRSFEWS